MTTAFFTAADYTAAIAALRPPGIAWSIDPDSEQMTIMAAISGGYERTDAAAQALLVDAFPATAIGLLPEWEASLGLPDPCVGPEPTTAQAQAQVVARLTGDGGQAAAHYIAYAASLGFTISIQTYAAWRCGVNGCGQPLYGPQWAYVWGVTIDEPSTQGFANSVLLCEFAGMASAETTVFLTNP